MDPDHPNRYCKSPEGGQIEVNHWGPHNDSTSIGQRDRHGPDHYERRPIRSPKPIDKYQERQNAECDLSIRYDDVGNVGKGASVE